MPTNNVIFCPSCRQSKNIDSLQHLVNSNKIFLTYGLCQKCRFAIMGVEIKQKLTSTSMSILVDFDKKEFANFNKRAKISVNDVLDIKETLEFPAFVQSISKK